MELQDGELEAVREGMGLEDFDVALGSKRDRAEREYLLHVQVHGC